LREDPNRWKKLTAPSWPPEGAPGLARRSDQRFASVPADGAQEDAEHGARDARVVLQVRSQALRDRENPLPCGEVRQDVVGEVSCHLAHATCVTRGVDAPALA